MSKALEKISISSLNSKSDGYEGLSPSFEYNNSKFNKIDFTYSNDLESLEISSFIHFKYLKEKYKIKPYELWFCSTSLITFIQYVLLRKRFYELNLNLLTSSKALRLYKFSNKIENINLENFNFFLLNKKTCSVYSSKICNYLLKKIKPKKIKIELIKIENIKLRNYKIISLISSFLKIIFKNKSQKKLTISKHKHNINLNKKIDNFNFDFDFADLIGKWYFEIYKRPKFNLISNIFSSININYSGMQMYNTFILTLFSNKLKKNLSITSNQHGGHNYVTSRFNFFLYNEYWLSNYHILFGSENPQIKYNESKTIFKYSPLSTIVKRKIITNNHFCFVTTGKIHIPLRIDGNPLPHEWKNHKQNCENFLNTCSWSINYKPYPDEITIWSYKEKYFNKTLTNLSDKTILNEKFVICDHIGTTFYRSLYLGVLCILLIDNSFKLTYISKSIFKDFIISKNYDIEPDKKINLIKKKWNNGSLENSRRLILEKFYSL